jgi:hypothetical protein
MIKRVNWKHAVTALFFGAYSTFLSADNDDDTIAAKPVSVKQKEGNSFKAKQKATTRATRLAFFQMLKENYDVSQETMGKLSLEQINQCISGCSIEQEKQSEFYYIARLAYKFNRETVEHLLESKGLGQRLSQKATTIAYPISAQNSGRLELPTSVFMAHRESLEKIGCSILEFSSKRIVLRVKSIDALKAINLGSAAIIASG